MEMIIKVVEDALITPFLCTNKNEFAYNVYDKRNKPVNESNLIRGADQFNYIPREIPYLSKHEHTKLSGNYIFAGVIDSHYGHAITEGISRLWPMLLFDNSVLDGFIFITRTNRNGRTALNSSFYKELFRYLKKDGLEIHVINETPIKVESCFVPTQSVILGNDCHHIQYDFTRQYANHIVDKVNLRENKIYLSRRLFHGSRRMINEIELEKYLIKKGFLIVYPEQIDFIEQISIYANCVTVIGCEGTALHNSLFCPKNTTIISIGAKNRRNQTQLQICKASNQQFYLHEVDILENEWELDLKKFDLFFIEKDL